MASMVTRTRWQRFFHALVLHLGAFALIGYFAFHAYHGNYGIMAQRAFEEEIRELITERDALKAERGGLERRNRLLAPDSLDPDVIEELARRDLGYGFADDVVRLDRAR
jgi:cell division protein FtsB